jgi:glyoxylase-like metal-dependent hydrolase (beta-lactamase superfamily II)
MKLVPIHTGYFKLDGGAMFGVVPKTMWEKLNPPDQNNLCTWAMRALLVDTGNRVILIDTGIGEKQEDKFRSHFQPHGEESLVTSIQAAGYKLDQITDVLLTHLHFDHCGGALFLDQQGKPTPRFPNAIYWSNQRHWDWAMQPNEREKASFLKENFLPLHHMGLIRMIDVNQNITWLPDIKIKYFYGHTEALMAPVLSTPKGQLIYCADTLPARWHIGMPYVMAYDIRPLVTIKEKEKLFQETLKTQSVLFLEHDPGVESCRLHFDTDKKRYTAGAIGSLADLLN